MIRAASLRGLVPLVDGLGGNGAALLKRFRIPAALAASDDGLLPVATYNAVLEAAAREVGRSDFGLLLASRQDATILGPLAIAVEASATVSEALECAARFLFVHSPELSVSVEDDPEGEPGAVGLVYRNKVSAMPYSAQGVELGLALFHRMMLLFNGGPYGLKSVHVPHQPLSPVARYRAVFDADVRFGREAATLRVPRELLEQTFAGANQALRDVVVGYLADRFPAPGQSVTSRVRLALAETIGATPPLITTVARLLLLHPRTLQRQLSAEGSSFNRLVDEVRREAAHRLITQTDLAFSQVTEMTGFAEQSALTRAVRRWFGQTPSALRAHGTQG